MYGPLGVRGAPMPEFAHPLWGDTTRALSSAGLKPSVMKGTLLCNFYRGPFQSGTAGTNLQEAATLLAETCSEEFLADLSPAYARDMKLDEGYSMTRDDILQCPGVATRLPAGSCAPLYTGFSPATQGTHARTHRQRHTCTILHVSADTHTHTHAHAHAHAHGHTDTQTHTHTHTHRQTHTHTHAHTDR